MSILAVHGQDFTIHVEVPAVSVDVSVTDSNGLPVKGLAASDFEVFENGVPQKIRYFGPSTAPYNAYLLVDVSGSTQHKRRFMRSAVDGFVRALGSGDRVAVGVFAHARVTVSDWDDPPAGALDALDPILNTTPVSGTSAVYESLGRAIAEGFEGIPERRAIIILTDGRDTALYQAILRRNRVPEPDEDGAYRSLARRAQTSGVAVYFVAINTDLNLETNSDGADEYRNLELIYGDSPLPEQYLRAVRTRMEDIAALSGGRVAFPASIADVAETFEEIAHELSQAYSLGYTPDEQNGPELRRIEVRVGRPGYSVRQSRSEYRVQRP